MTIHQPAQMVFDMLQDLYLLENGRLAYFGPLKSTEEYFAALDIHCPKGVNPADFYLDQMSKRPDENDENKTWTQIYNSSIFAVNFSVVVQKTIEASTRAGPPQAPPNYLDRLSILIKFFIRYYTRDIGFYYLRILFLVVIALFLGTLFLQLTTYSDNISKYSGSVFFSIWTTLFSAVAATGLLASDRRLAIEQVKTIYLTRPRTRVPLRN